MHRGTAQLQLNRLARHRTAAQPPRAIDATFTGGIAARRTRGLEDGRTDLRAKTTVPSCRISRSGGPRAVLQRCLRPVPRSHGARGSSAGACAVPPSTRLVCGRTKTLRASVGSTEASNGRLARVGVVGPTRARLTYPSYRRIAIHRARAADVVITVPSGRGPWPSRGTPLARRTGAVAQSTMRPPPRPIVIVSRSRSGRSGSHKAISVAGRKSNPA